MIAKNTGDAAGAISAAATKLEAVYQLPFLSHAPMEPLNCTLHIQPDQAEIWVGTQVPVRAQKAVAAATGLPQDKVTVNNLYMGGAFGRRLDIDSIEIAAALAKQVPYPVKLVWTREEDTATIITGPITMTASAPGWMQMASWSAGRTASPAHR